MKGSWVGVALACIGGFSSSGALLRRDLKPGTADVYVIKCTATTLPDGGAGDPKSNTVTWTGTYSVTAQNPDKTGTLVVDITGLKIAGDSGPAKPGAFKPITTKSTIDERGRIDPFESPRKPNTNVGWLLLDNVEFPEKEVAIGDTWDFALPQNIFTTTSRIVVHAKLLAEQPWNGHGAWQIQLQAPSEHFQQHMTVQYQDTNTKKEATLSGTLHFEGDALVDKESGRILTLAENAHIDQEFKVEGAKRSTRTQVEYSASMTLKG